jgi:hypothetical protein
MEMTMKTITAKLSVWWTNPESSSEPYLHTTSDTVDMTDEGWIRVATHKARFEIEIPTRKEIAPVFMAAIDKKVDALYASIEDQVQKLRGLKYNFLALEHEEHEEHEELDE